MNSSSTKRFLFITTALMFVAVSQVKAKDSVDYVNPNIGGIAHLLVATAPLVQMPHAMVELAYNPWPYTRDHYTASKIASFSMRALPRYAITNLPSWIMATTGRLQVDDDARASFFDHDFETVTPYYSSFLLEDYKVRVEYTVTEHAGYYRFTFPKSSNANILIGNNQAVEIESNNVIKSVEQLEPYFYTKDNQRACFYIEFSKPISVCGTWTDGKIQPESKAQSGDSIGAFAQYATSQGEQIEVKFGVSCIDMDQAQQNLEREIPGLEF